VIKVLFNLSFVGWAPRFPKKVMGFSLKSSKPLLARRLLDPANNGSDLVF
jgi:hypothetical protein